MDECVWDGRGELSGSRKVKRSAERVEGGKGDNFLRVQSLTSRAAARETVVDFTRPYFMESSACASRAPKERSRAFAVLSPFKLEASDSPQHTTVSFLLFVFNFIIRRSSWVKAA